MNKKTRLMQITHDLALGGLQQVIVNICKAIDREKFDISVLCLKDLGEFVPEVEKLGIKVRLLPQAKGTDYVSFLKVARILREEQVEVIHTHNTQPFIDGTIGAILSGSVKTIIHTDHARFFPDKRRYMFAEWLMSQFAYKVVGVSDHTSEDLKNYEKISPKKIITIMNGIDPGKYQLSFDKDKKRSELGISNTGQIIGLGVRIEEQKGITYLLKAMPAIKEEFPDISLIIAGKGSLEESLKKESQQLGLEKNVFFVGPRTDMHELIRLFDLYVLPSNWEGLPIVLLEAMAAGCPIVATAVGGNSMAVQNGHNGSLIEPRSPRKLADEVIRVLSNQSLREQYVKNSHDIFNAKFSAQIMTSKYEKLYLRNN
jgi:glycosyltransferase involved in cell wall biosynthesis